MNTHICLERNDGFICSLNAGHIGPHRAEGVDGFCYKAWGDEPQLKVVCAWCFPGVKFDVPVSHGICPRHRDEMLAQIRKEEAA